MALKLMPMKKNQRETDGQDGRILAPLLAPRSVSIHMITGIADAMVLEWMVRPHDAATVVELAHGF